MNTVTIANKKKMKNALFIAFFIFFLLLIRIGFLQLINGNLLNAEAVEQQAIARKISAKRGTIYDSTGKYIFAVSANVETVTINPTNITSENKEKVAKKLSELFEIDYEKTLKKVKKRSSIETIVRKVEKTKTDELRIWMNENNINTGINIDEDTKRYYPYRTLASHVIGFCGSDNQGLDGIEARYDSILKGTNGTIEKMTDATGGEVGEKGEKYTAAIDGKNLILSIDMTIQSIVEKYLEEACIDNICTDGGSIIIMNPKTGDVLAMATYPNYDLNEPYKINSIELENTWDTLEQSKKSENLQAMWRNKAISDTYEPGSVFKLITASASLEEKITDTDKKGEFCCTGGIEVAGIRIKCWRYYRPHGAESLREALMNSCNPVFIGLGQKLGVTKYFSYLRKFGLLDKTGINLAGEAKGIFIAENKCGPVELGTISFGQRFEITPIQMVTAVCGIANGGKKVVPRIVKKIVDEKSGESEEVEVKYGERIISEETSQKVLSMMESVVSEGTGKNARVAGYRIGGKTGTSEDGVNTGKYVTSFCGVAPINDPQIVMLITLYNPTGEGGHQGGGVAAPVGGKILNEVLPYLEVEQGNLNEVEKTEKIITPDITQKTLNDAEKIVKENGLNIEIVGQSEKDDKTDEIILNQIPQAGIEIYKGSTIYVNY